MKSTLDTIFEESLKRVEKKIAENTDNNDVVMNIVEEAIENVDMQLLGEQQP